MSDPVRDTSAHGISRTALAMLIGVLALGTLISWKVIGTHGASDITRRGDALPSRVDSTDKVELTTALVGAGAIVVQQRCAGCHDATQRSVGPSWNAVLARYKSVIGTKPLNHEALAVMVAAISHPQPGWDGYSAGPTDITLTPEERSGTAAWILSRSKTVSVKELSHE